MIYLKWRLSEGTMGTGPERDVVDRGGMLRAGWAVEDDGYRIGYLTQTTDWTGLETWDVTEVAEAQALTFCQQFYAEAEVTADEHISGPPPPEIVE